MFTAEVIKSAFTAPRTMSGDSGFTYPAALLMVVVISVSLMTAQKQWSILMQRERERQLFFRAEQITCAIESYFESTPGADGRYPRKLEHLLKDNRFPAAKRHLRKLYKDPMTGDGTWGIIHDGRGRIKGIYSRSGDKPLKVGGFDEKYKSFKGKNKYSEWKFVYEPEKEKNS